MQPATSVAQQLAQFDADLQKLFWQVDQDNKNGRLVELEEQRVELEKQFKQQWFPRGKSTTFYAKPAAFSSLVLAISDLQLSEQYAWAQEFVRLNPFYLFAKDQQGSGHYLLSYAAAAHNRDFIAWVLNGQEGPIKLLSQDPLWKLYQRAIVQAYGAAIAMSFDDLYKLEGTPVLLGLYGADDMQLVLNSGMTKAGLEAGMQYHKDKFETAKSKYLAQLKFLDDQIETEKEKQRMMEVNLRHFGRTQKREENDE